MPLKTLTAPTIIRACFAAWVIVILAGCAADSGIVPGHDRMRVGDGLSKLLRTVGKPEYRRGEQEGEVLQYCSTGLASDAYVVYWVRQGKIYGITNYSRSVAIGPCVFAFKQLTWSDAPESLRRPNGSNKPERSGVASGTGFFINPQGAILTNAHVVDGCKSIMVRSVGAAVVQVADVATDLAVLRVSGTTARPYARFDRAKVTRLGEEVVVFGYPLSGALASSGNLTTGNVSALAGIGNDVGRYQISAPVQQGNSGGPLLDRSGNVLGVVVSKLNTLSAAAATGDIPQNVNFAIKGAFTKTFLDVNNVAYMEADSGTAQSIADVAAMAQRFTVFIECKLDG